MMVKMPMPPSFHFRGELRSSSRLHPKRSHPTYLLDLGRTYAVEDEREPSSSQSRKHPTGGQQSVGMSRAKYPENTTCRERLRRDESWRPNAAEGRSLVSVHGGTTSSPRLGRLDLSILSRITYRRGHPPCPQRSVPLNVFHVSRTTARAAAEGLTAPRRSRLLDQRSALGVAMFPAIIRSGTPSLVMQIEGRTH
jgi:hypothetical protein